MMSLHCNYKFTVFCHSSSSVNIGLDPEVICTKAIFAFLHTYTTPDKHTKSPEARSYDNVFYKTITGRHFFVYWSKLGDF